MAKFNAATAVDPLDFDFSAFSGPTGTIPEPTDDQVASFNNALLGFAKELGIRPGQQLSIDMVADIPEDVIKSMASNMVDAVLILVGNAFTKEDFEKLPYRIRAAFMAWIAGEINPNQGAPGTKR